MAMDLYMTPMTCSLAVHVACLEAGISPNLLRVARVTKLLDDGRDYRELAPQGAVPVIALPDGTLLSESTAVLQYIADRDPGKQLAPPWGSIERYRLMEWLNFVSTELHKKLMWPVFSSKASDAMKAWAREHAGPTLEHVARQLGDREFALGDRFTVADAYLWWTLFVAPHGGISLGRHPSLKAYVERIRQRPSVAAALAHDVPLYTAEAAAGTAPVSRLQSSTAS